MLLLALLAGCGLPDDKPSDAASVDADTGTDSAPCDTMGWLPDVDGDGFGDDASEPVYACEGPAGYAATGGDCDDTDAAVNPDAAERCDTEADDNCDGATNEDGAEDCSERWLDADDDGYGSDGRCMCPLDGTDTGDGPYGSYTASEGGDCDDTNPAYTTDCSGPTFVELSTATARLVCEAGADACGGVAAVGDFDGDGALDAALAPHDRGVRVVPVPTAGDAGIAATTWTSFGDIETVVGAAELDGATGDELVLSTISGSDGEYWSARQLTVHAWGGPDLSTPTATFVGEEVSGWGITYGAAVVGDIDADGRDDVLAWAGEDFSAGRLWWPRLADGGDTTADTLSPLMEDVWRGVHGPGDLDGDGVDDLVVESLDGQVLIFDGPVPAVITQADARAAFTAGDDCGADCLGAWVPGGDLDGDGLFDLLAVQWSTYVYVLPGPGTGGDLVSNAVAQFGTLGGYHTLSATDARADLDGDVRADLVFGAEDSSDVAESGGLAGVVYGPLAGTRGVVDADVLWAGAEIDELGSTATHAGDLDGDGLGEVLVGARKPDLGAGRQAVTFVFGGW